MVEIHTKKLRKKWFCFAAINGYDYSYSSKIKELAQNKMKDKLKFFGIEGLFLEEEIIPDPPPESKAQIIWQKNRIDNL